MPPVTQRLQLLKNSVFTGITALSGVFLLLLFLAAAHVWGVEPLGVLALGLAISAGVAFGTNLGIDSIAIRRIATQQSPDATIAQLLQLRLCITLVTLAVLVAAALLPANDGERAMAILLYGAAGALRAANFSCRAVLHAHERFSIESLVMVGETLLVLVAGLVALDRGGGPIAIGYVLVGVRTASLAAYLALVLPRANGRWQRLDWSTAKGFFRESIPIGIGTLLGVFFWQSDTFLIAALSTEYATGIFSAASRIVAELTIVPNVLAAAVFPRLAMLHASAPARFHDIAARSCKYMIVAGGAIACVAAPNAERLIALVYGADFAPSAEPFFVLILLTPVFFFYPLVFTAFRASGDQVAMMWILVTGVAVKIAAGAALIPAMAATGATAAAAVGIVVTATGALVVVGHREPGILRNLAVAGRALAAIAVALGAGVLARGWPLPLNAAAVLAVYLGALLALRTFDTHELELARHVLLRARLRG